MLIMEMGIGQAEALRACMERSGAYRDIIIRKDLAGIDRVIAARKK
jgi:methylase of polypeptide subunit release factors